MGHGNLDLSVAKTPEMLEFEYARSALKNGLKLEAQLGVNPYKYGMIGSTDAHTSLSAVEENNFFGKLPHHEPSAGRATHPLAKFGDKVVMGWEVVSSGYAAVWATENTREAIFDAMKRKEVYATTGPRMLVRFFGGWDFVDADANTRSPAVAGYTKGVPMGGDFRRAGGQGADLPGRRAEGPDRRQPRPLPDRQGLDGRGRGSCTRRSMTSSGRATASPAPTASCRRSATRSMCRTRPGRTRSARPS